MLELVKPPLQEALLGVVVGERQRPVVGVAGLRATVEAAQQIAAGRVQVAVVVELEAIDYLQAGLRALVPRRPRPRG